MHADEDAALQEARDCFEQANARLSELRDNFPGIPLYRYELANSQNNLARVLFGLGEHALARKELEFATVELNQLAAKFQEHSSEVADCHSLQGNVLGGRAALALQMDKDPQEAHRLVTLAIQCQTEALKISPNNANYADRLKQHEAFLSQIEKELPEPKTEPPPSNASSAESRAERADSLDSPQNNSR
jgi:hypothetical protein